MAYEQTVSKFYPPKGKGPALVLFEGQEASIKGWDVPALNPGDVIRFEAETREYEGEKQIYFKKGAAIEVVSRGAPGASSSRAGEFRTPDQLMRGQAMALAIEAGPTDVYAYAEEMYRWIKDGSIGGPMRAEPEPQAPPAENYGDLDDLDTDIPF